MVEVTWSAFELWALPLVGAGAGAYIGSYLKEKGKNLATQEDIGRLVEQLKATTEATKRIENTISDEFWNKQRVWEMKRDSLIGLLNAVSRVEAAMREMHTAKKILAIGETHEARTIFDKASFAAKDAIVEIDRRQV